MRCHCLCGYGLYSVCVYMQVLLCILCMVNTFSLQSASLALTPMTSLFILPALTLSSLPLSHLSLPLISLYPSLLFSLTTPCHFCPSLFYLLTICGYSTRPLWPHVISPSAELPIILLLSLLGILIVQMPTQDFL